MRIFNFLKSRTMRLILSLLVLFALNSAHAQDICSKIKKDVSADKMNVDMESPYEEANQPLIRVSRSYSTNEENPFDNFYVIFRVSCDLDSIYTKDANGGQVEKEEKGVIIEFEDHSKLTDEELKVNHDLSDDHMSAVRYAYLIVNDQNLKSLTTKGIIKFTLAGSSGLVSPDQASVVMEYVKCMKAVK